MSTKNPTAPLFACLTGRSGLTGFSVNASQMEVDPMLPALSSQCQPTVFLSGAVSTQSHLRSALHLPDPQHSAHRADWIPSSPANGIILAYTGVTRHVRAGSNLTNISDILKVCGDLRAQHYNPISAGCEGDERS